MPIRVLQSISAYSFGGIETLVRQLFDRIAPRFQMDFLVHDLGPNADLDHYESRGARVVRLRASAKTDLAAYLREVRGAFISTGRRYDIFHCHSALYGTLHAAAAARSGVPVRIAHSHASAPDSMQDWLKSKAVLPMHRLMHTHQVACSKSAARYVFGSRNKTVILPNGIATEKFQFDGQARADIRRRLDLGGDLVVGHTGRLCHPKNHTKILKVFKQIRSSVPNAKLLLVGDGPLLGTLQGLALDLGIVDGVRFLGRRADIPALLSAMDVFLFPSHYESFPLSPLEARANGLPVILTEGVAEALGPSHAIGRLALASSDADWAGAVLSIVGQRDTSGRINDSMRPFCIDTFVRNIEQIYDRALASAGNATP